MFLFRDVVVFQHTLCSIQLLVLCLISLFLMLTLDGPCRQKSKFLQQSKILPHSKLASRSPVILALIGCLVCGTLHNIGGFIVSVKYCKLGLQISSLGYIWSYFFVNVFLYLKQHAVHKDMTSSSLVHKVVRGLAGSATLVLLPLGIANLVSLKANVYMDRKGDLLCSLDSPVFTVMTMGACAIVCGCGYFFLFVSPVWEVRRHTRQPSKLTAVIVRNLWGFLASTIPPLLVMLCIALIEALPRTDQNLASLAVTTNCTLIDNILSILAMLYSIWPSWSSSQQQTEHNSQKRGGQDKSKRAGHGEQEMVSLSSKAMGHDHTEHPNMEISSQPDASALQPPNFLRIQSISASVTTSSTVSDHNSYNASSPMSHMRTIPPLTTLEELPEGPLRHSINPNQPDGDGQTLQRQEVDVASAP